MERFIKVLKAHGKSVVVYTKGKYEDTTAGEMRDEDIRNVMKRLCEYEDTGLTPSEIMELNERDTAKVPVKVTVPAPYINHYACPHCNSGLQELFRFCPICGQRLKWKEE